MSKKKKQKQKKIIYQVRSDSEQLTKEFVQRFNYTFWYHKINALYNYISNPEKIESEIKFPYDTEQEETIIENFKLEIHMNVFHSAETLFLVIFGYLFEPKSVPLWISRCSNTTLANLIKKLSEKGLDGFISNSVDWLQSVLYPSIDPNHPKFLDAVSSTKFTKNFLKRLAQEYVDHHEYNSYKHGLRCNSGQISHKIINEQTGKIELDSKSDGIVFLEYDKINKGNTDVYRIKESSKAYELDRDANLIVTITQIFSNIFDYRQLVIKRELVGSSCKIKFLPYFYKTEKVDTLFDFSSKNNKNGIITRFSSDA